MHVIINYDFHCVLIHIVVRTVGDSNTWNCTVYSHLNTVSYCHKLDQLQDSLSLMSAYRTSQILKGTYCVIGDVVVFQNTYCTRNVHEICLFSLLHNTVLGY